MLAGADKLGRALVRLKSTQQQCVPWLSRLAILDYRNPRPISGDGRKPINALQVSRRSLFTRVPRMAPRSGICAIDLTTSDPARLGGFHAFIVNKRDRDIQHRIARENAARRDKILDRLPNPPGVGALVLIAIVSHVADAACSLRNEEVTLCYAMSLESVSGEERGRSPWPWSPLPASHVPLLKSHSVFSLLTIRPLRPTSPSCTLLAYERVNQPGLAQTFAEPRMIVTRLTAELRRVASPEVRLRGSREVRCSDSWRMSAATVKPTIRKQITDQTWEREHPARSTSWSYPRSDHRLNAESEPVRDADSR